MLMIQVHDPERLTRGGVEQIRCPRCNQVVMEREWSVDYRETSRDCACGVVVEIAGIENTARFSGLREFGHLLSWERPRNLPEDTAAMDGFDDNEEAQLHHERMESEWGCEYTPPIATAAREERRR